MIIKIIILLCLLLIAYKNNINLVHDNIDNICDYNKNYQACIPKKIHQTYYDKKKIPQKVYDNIKKYAPEYNHIIYDDVDCVNYLHKYYGKEFVNLFNSFEKGAHKADLFRYCVLYNEGGVYLDIKTELIQPIKDIFNEKDTFYSVLSIIKKTIYQGVIATPPNNKIFLKLIYFMLKIKKPVKKYIIFTKHLYAVIAREIEKKKLYEGYNYNYNKSKTIYKFFTEKCTKNISNCYDGLDKYGLCCYIKYNNKNIIKTRYSDFPW